MALLAAATLAGATSSAASSPKRAHKAAGPAGKRLERQIESLIESTPAARAAFWGIQALDLSTGRTLYSSNASRFFVPASNTKLFTTALALMRLTPDYRFETRVLADSAPDPAGRVRGDLVLVGGADPTLSGRLYPYRKDAPPQSDPLRGIEELADALVRRGVRAIDGDIVGDDTAFVWAPYPDGWTQDDELWDYGAPVSALSINDNTFSLEVRPAERAGALSTITLTPPLEYFRVLNRVDTAAAGGGERRIGIERAPGSRELVLWGSLPKDGQPWSQVLAIDDPALYAATALEDALTRRGVAVGGQAVARHLAAQQVAGLLERGPAPPPPAGVLLARRESPPLAQIAQAVDKVSQNLHAEILLRETARRRRGIGSREAGLQEMEIFLAEVGVPRDSWRFEDGSGLSRLTLVMPRAVTTLLAFMYRSRYRDLWLSLLPVGGEDGTLAARFDGRPEGRRILAKTGSLSHVSALSGYARRPGGGGDVAFSILVNNYNAPVGEVRRVMDDIALRLAAPVSRADAR